MGIRRENGYSAFVSAFLTVGSHSYAVAKINRDRLTLADPCEFTPGTEGVLVIEVDGHKSARTVSLADGVACGQREVRYSVLVPF